MNRLVRLRMKQSKQIMHQLVSPHTGSPAQLQTIGVAARVLPDHISIDQADERFKVKHLTVLC
ncbi:MAG: hypothetical protein JWP57_3460 [Spirosoma sp.]|nr:hypothetical protein [Spirosoma sp.]